MFMGDLNAVLAIENQAYEFPWTRGNFVDSLAAGYLAAVVEEPLAGVVGYYVAMAGMGEMHLLNLAVAPSWQGRGLAARLLQALVARCVEFGHEALWLEVRASNARARSLYARLGFTEVGLRRAYYPARFAAREDAIVMRRTLPPRACDGLD
ncbi:MAG: ribosomal protein S18-alanine N-acetyltransferase [Burkholderiales bacterium]|nr:ribosomal protein S18-alanine N-acetyltransferase [Burkholderiales bacterium]